MALTPISSSNLPRVQPADGGPARAAQRAFFNAALGKADAAPAPQPVTAVVPVAPTRVATTQVQTQTETSEPNRAYRPGSRLDIRV